MERLTVVNHGGIQCTKYSAPRSVPNTACLGEQHHTGICSSLLKFCRHTVFAREQFCSEANIIACFCYTKLYLQHTVRAFDRTTSAIHRSSKNGSPKESHTRARWGGLNWLAQDKFRIRTTCLLRYPARTTADCCPSSNRSSWPSERLSMNPSLRFERRIFPTTASYQCCIPWMRTGVRRA